MVNTLSCSATGKGIIFYKWEKYDSSDDSWTRPFPSASSITSSTLTFSMITEEDKGIYRCVVSNYDGNVVSSNATITVYGKYITRQLYLFSNQQGGC